MIVLVYVVRELDGFMVSKFIGLFKYEFKVDMARLASLVFVVYSSGSMFLCGESFRIYVDVFWFYWEFFMFNCRDVFDWIMFLFGDYVGDCQDFFVDFLCGVLCNVNCFVYFRYVNVFVVYQCFFIVSMYQCQRMMIVSLIVIISNVSLWFRRNYVRLEYWRDVSQCICMGCDSFSVFRCEFDSFRVLIYYVSILVV